MKKLLIVCTVLLACFSLGLAAKGSTVKKATADEVICPVMGTKMTKDKAYSTQQYKGETYYLCCKACDKAFKKDPAKYISKIECQCPCCKSGKCKGECCKSGKCMTDCCNDKNCTAKCCQNACKNGKCDPKKMKMKK